MTYSTHPRASRYSVSLPSLFLVFTLFASCQTPPPDAASSAGAGDATASPTSSIAPTPATIVENASPTPSETFSINPASAPLVLPTINPSPASSAAPAAAAEGELLIPVAGITFADLQNTFKDARSGGRVHDAIDIIAPRGTPVVAVADGRIVKLFNSERGGITLYQLSIDEKIVYYYAHLDRYADNIAEGKTLRRGDILGYVGDTGNATPGNYHLHFSVALIKTPRDIHNGTYLNPYDLFKAK